jgi:hypothetical protein
MDEELVLSDEQAITVTARSEDTIDQTVGGDAGDELYLVLLVQEAFDSAGDAATLVVDLETDSTAAFPSAKNLWKSPTYVEADLVVGKLAQLRLPKGTEQFIGLNYTNAVEAFTAGKIDAFLTKDPNWGNS